MDSLTVRPDPVVYNRNKRKHESYEGIGFRSSIFVGNNSVFPFLFFFLPLFLFLFFPRVFYRSASATDPSRMTSGIFIHFILPLPILSQERLFLVLCGSSMAVEFFTASPCRVYIVHYILSLFFFWPAKC